MNQRFYRAEAARFREMADDTDREATKLRLLATAADYDARAKAADHLTEPSVPDVEGGVIEPDPRTATKVDPGRKTARALKETILVERRPIVRRV